MTQYILVAGGCGYIGSHVVVELIKNGFDVVIADNLSNSSINQLDEIIKVLHLGGLTSKPKFELIDLTINSQVEQLFKNYKFEGVILLAGLKAVGESLEFPHKYYQTNLNITTNLLYQMSIHKCYQLIFSSSATVYGSQGKPPLKESDQIGNNLTNPYGYTKFNIETILDNLCQFDKNFKITSLRYFNPIGCHSSGKLIDNPKQPNNILPVILNSIKNKEPFYVFGTDYPTKDGSAERDYINITDLARAHVCAYKFIKYGYNVYNVGTGCPISVLKLINIFEQAGQKLNYILTDKRPGDVDTSYADCQKINNELGWYAKVPIDTTIKECLNWINNSQ